MKLLALLMTSLALMACSRTPLPDSLLKQYRAVTITTDVQHRTTADGQPLYGQCYADRGGIVLEIHAGEMAASGKPLRFRELTQWLSDAPDWCTPSAVLLEPRLPEWPSGGPAPGHLSSEPTTTTRGLSPPSPPPSLPPADAGDAPATLDSGRE